ncbi:glycosyltransferase family 4 protein [Pelagibacteraceae bacterium]|nr:glycosyltransferase family 4 protein [Pelagibacteraceae bacterium]
MKKILIVTPNVSPIPDVDGGATENLITILLEENEKYKKNKFYICSKYTNEALNKSHKFDCTDFFYYKKRFQLNIYEILTRIFLIIKKILCYKKYTISNYHFWALDIAKKINPDYIIAPGGIYENFELFKDIFGRKKVYAWIHRNQIKTKKLDKIFYKGICVSNHICRVWDSKSKHRSSILLRNCYDNNRFYLTKSNLSRQNLGIPEDLFLVAYCGRLIKEKGVRELIYSISKFKQNNIGLLLIGSSFYKDSKNTKYQNDLKKLSNKLKVKIYETGFIHGSILRNYLILCDLCVVPSVYQEPVALVPLESMGVGLPVIITDVGGMKEYYDGKSLLKVTTKNLIQNLYNKIKFLRKNPKLLKKLKINGLKLAKKYQRKEFYFNFTNIFK